MCEMAMPTLRMTASGSKSVQTWTTFDILNYYSAKLLFQYGFELRVPNQAARAAFLGRVKTFQHKLHLSNQQYKDFIDDVFKLLFTNRRFTPSFGAIISERVYHLVSALRNGCAADTSFIYNQPDLANPAPESHAHAE